MNRSDARKQATALVAQMTPDEKISQLLHTAPAIPRLGIRAYNWWNEALHGVARAGLATVFPQAIGMAAAFSPALVGEAASVIAEEARAKYNMAQKEGDTGIYKGLTFWSPNINIFRDPRWGRGQETYGEDPFLTAEDGMAFVRALQGDGEYMKAAACAKHFAVHSGPEELRHSFDAEADARDLAETYLPAFEKLVREAHVEAVMGAYNRTNGEPCCGSKTLLADTLRGKWGFSGHVVSDCGAINDFHLHHHVTETAEDAAAMALDAGCDLNCGRMFAYLAAALADGKITEAQLDEAATRLFTTRVLLGEFDENNPYNDIPYERVDCAEHQALNREIARQSLVLLKNDGYLPRDPASVSTVAVIGPNAASVIALEGNYSGTAGEYITPADGIRRALPGARVYVSRGSHLYKNKLEGCSAVPDDRLSEAAAMARRADLVLLCVGLDSTIEGEQGDASNFGAAGDKIDLRLPECQRHLVRTVCEASDNVVVAVLAGSAIDLGADAAGHNAVVFKNGIIKRDFQTGNAVLCVKFQGLRFVFIVDIGLRLPGDCWLSLIYFVAGIANIRHAVAAFVSDGKRRNSEITRAVCAVFHRRGIGRKAVLADKRVCRAERGIRKNACAVLDICLRYFCAVVQIENIIFIVDLNKIA